MFSLEGAVSDADRIEDDDRHARRQIGLGQPAWIRSAGDDDRRTAKQYEMGHEEERRWWPFAAGLHLRISAGDR